MHLIAAALSLVLLQPSWGLDDPPFCINDVAKECRCVRQDGSILDLNSAASKNVSAPRFVSKDEDLAELIQFNPCFGFLCGKRGTTPDAAVCDTNAEGQFNIVLGVQSSLKIVASDNNAVAVYSNEKFQVFITLLCSNIEGFGTFEAHIRNGSMQRIYDATLASRHACFAQPLEPIDDASDLSTGDVLLIFFFSSLGGYLLLGSAFKIFVKRERGWAILPNHRLWLSLPGLILEGVNFAFCGVCSGVTGNYGDI